MKTGTGERWGAPLSDFIQRNPGTESARRGILGQTQESGDIESPLRENREKWGTPFPESRSLRNDLALLFHFLSGATCGRAGHSCPALERGPRGREKGILPETDSAPALKRVLLIRRAYEALKLALSRVEGSRSSAQRLLRICGVIA